MHCCLQTYEQQKCKDLLFRKKCQSTSHKCLLFAVGLHKFLSTYQRRWPGLARFLGSCPGLLLGCAGKPDMVADEMKM